MLKRVVFGLSVLWLASIASAASVTYSGSIATQSTNWSSSITVPQFDPSLGTLNSITFSLTGHVAGSAGFESLDAAPATILMHLQAELALQRPDLSTLVVTIPFVETLDSASVFDGVIDFGGTSGKSYTNLSGSLTETQTSPPPLSDLALFTGTGNIILPVVATGQSHGEGAGNLLLSFSTQAGADASVTYNYTSAVPLPGTAWMGGVALGVLGVWRWRRAAAQNA